MSKTLILLYILFIGSVGFTVKSWNPPSGTAQAQPAEPAKYKEVRGKDGFWRIVKDDNGVWWFMSPSGSLEFMNNIQNVHPEQSAGDPKAQGYRAAGFSGDVKAWASTVPQRVKDLGFKGVGAWSHRMIHSVDVPVSRDLNVWASVPGEDRLIFSDKWPDHVRRIVAEQCSPLSENKNLIGYFTDNELHWNDDGMGPGLHFDGRAVNDPNRKEVVALIRRMWPSLVRFNEDWDANMVSWKELDDWQRLPRGYAYTVLTSRWLEHVAQTYFKTVWKAIKTSDPNHLILGVRFNHRPPLGVTAASRGFVDAHSINQYNDGATLYKNMCLEMYLSSDAPLILSEFTFYSPDNLSGNKNTKGFGGLVRDRQARASAYERVVRGAAKSSFFVGIDFFQLNDEPPSGRFDGEDLSCGFVSVNDVPYPEMVEVATRMREQQNTIHASATTEQFGAFWVEDAKVVVSPNSAENRHPPH